MIHPVKRLIFVSDVKTVTLCRLAREKYATTPGRLGFGRIRAMNYVFPPHPVTTLPIAFSDQR
ncbi:MAG: hypothetical protein Q8R95_16195, partial [Azonexus sp.]|nr:hypothetical protein [Azonexus sp.]